VLDATLDQMRQAVDLGFGAVKMELLFEDLATDRDLVTCIQEGRRAVGDDVDLLVDFGYRWTHWRDAHQVLRKVEPQDIYLAEAPLQPDDLIGHARLGERVDTRVGGAETASSLDECRAWLEVGRVDVLQPDVGRAGGLSHMRRICELAALYGASVIPHCWRTGINAAAARHLHAALPNVPMVEFLPPQFSTSPLRHALVGDEPVVVDGFLELPSSPGLGVHLDLDTIERFVVRRGHGPVPADERGHRR
jgi:L-alanine-DL-glutamate epimerase-like enolase superfamily enzyme